MRERLKAKCGTTGQDGDGVRGQSEDGRWLLGAHKTQAGLVDRCEADREEGLKRVKGTLAEQLRASGLDAPDLA